MSSDDMRLHLMYAFLILSVLMCTLTNYVCYFTSLHVIIYYFTNFKLLEKRVRKHCFKFIYLIICK